MTYYVYIVPVRWNDAFLKNGSSAPQFYISEAHEDLNKIKQWAKTVIAREYNGRDLSPNIQIKKLFMPIETYNNFRKGNGTLYSAEAKNLFLELNARYRLIETPSQSAESVLAKNLRFYKTQNISEEINDQIDKEERISQRNKRPGKACVATNKKFRFCEPTDPTFAGGRKNGIETVLTDVILPWERPSFTTRNDSANAAMSPLQDEFRNI